MKTVTAALEYHDRTKHRRSRYAASLGYMDWATQPDPFRHYENTRSISLPHTDATPPYHLIFENNDLPIAPVCLESLSQLLRYALGLAAWKSAGGSSWALRCNASSGNLHPTEAYLILPPIAGISSQTVLTHYLPKEHALEILCEYDSTEHAPEEITVILTSVIWREAWKYGERCWRYCQLDAGHARNALYVSAAVLGWQCDTLPLDTSKVTEVLGFTDHERFAELEGESVDLILAIRAAVSANPFHQPTFPPIPPTVHANTLSPAHHPWPILEFIDKAAQGSYPLITPLNHLRKIPPPSRSAGDVILKRRSAQMMDGSWIHKAHFLQILDASFFEKNTPDVHFIIFVHRIEGLESGLYAYVRDEAQLDSLKNAMRDEFRWDECEENLYLLQSGDYRGAAQMVSCNQEIAKDGAFSFGMVCRFAHALEEYGASGYKNLFHQCGAIGQMLYLEATSLGLSATGIGCFLDDEFHALLGLVDMEYQSLYHFTVGRAIVDTRITTRPPY